MVKRSTATRVYLSVIGLLLAFAGGIFSWLMWRSFSRARAMESWPKVPCAILDSGVAERRIDPDAPPELRFEVLYSYEWEGEIYEGDRLGLRGSSWSSKGGKAAALVEAYPTGSVRECLVNPSTPDFAVLKGESRAPGYSIWFPLIFVVGGVGVVAGAWRR